MNGANRKIYDHNGLEIGSTIALTYVDHSDGIKKTNWVMHEYRLHPSFFKESHQKNTELVLCDIQESGRVFETKRKYEDHHHTSNKRMRTSILVNECNESEEPRQFDQTPSLVSPFVPFTSDHEQTELMGYSYVSPWSSLDDLEPNFKTNIIETPTTLMEHEPNANDVTFEMVPKEQKSYVGHESLYQESKHEEPQNIDVVTKEEDDKFNMVSSTEEVIREFLIEEHTKMNKKIFDG
ncbi:NAC domain-containing protein [Dioscorea alata]|uniref:NAC domain-containing protein n=1 Tax=Dioscorea alata TaxID=55571 RepID=A0ACB7UH74_DIOAL|nr:NAC domain-containing protein [Dioscorea alata]